MVDNEMDYLDIDDEEVVDLGKKQDKQVVKGGYGLYINFNLLSSSFN